MKTFLRRYRKRLYYLSALLLPLLIAGTGFAVRGIAPFGKLSLAAIDGYGQYFPMLREAERHFFHPAAWSFSGAFGFNFYSESAYYTNSPLNILLFLLPGRITVWETDLLVLLRFGLMSLSFSHLLACQRKRYSFLFTVLSSAWALSGYTLAFINQFMWMDALILLPLLILGLVRLVYETKPFLYMVCLFFLIVSCFYTAYMVCIFLCLFLAFQLAVKPLPDLKSTIFALCRFAAFSLFAGGILALPFLVPLIKALSHTIAADAKGPDSVKFLVSFREVFLQMLPFEKASLEYGAPNLFFGLFALVPLGTAAASRRICARVKAVSAVFLILLFLSMNLSVTDYVWHGFHRPSQLPGRESFLFIFLLLYLSSAGALRIRKKPQKLALGQLLLLEISANAVFSILSCPCVGVQRVVQMESAVDAVRDTITPDYTAGEFYRTELLSCRDNGGQLYGYPGISWYSSTMTGDAYRFFTKLGVGIYAKNVSVRLENPLSHPFLLDLFSVKYLVRDDGGLTENPDPLPLLFPASDHVIALEADALSSGVPAENALMQALSGTPDQILDGEGALIPESYGKARAALSSFGSCEVLKIREGLFRTTVIARAYIKKEGSCLFMSLPSSNISVWADGVRLQTESILGYAASVRLSPGVHEIRITVQ